MYTEACAPSSRNPGLSVHNRRITYLLGPCPGGPRHDGIDYANSRNRPSWPKPPRNYASTPSDSASPILVSLRLFLSPSFSLFLSAFSLFPHFFYLLFYSHSMPSLRPSLNLYTLSHPSSSTKDYSHFIASSFSFCFLSFLLLSSVPLFLSLLCNQNSNNLLRNCFDCSSIWVTTGYSQLCVGIDHLAIHWLHFSGRKGKGRRQVNREAVSSYLRRTLRILSIGDPVTIWPISSNISTINRGSIKLHNMIS